ncbi:DNA-binding storekeeper protein-relatedtranscriptional regulator [Striga asiatica]|uniref:DNA-binding storekeeper protein-relatedtranscriptional regulator n=1 Tax=Striga asiatica TaxID=4170 RepID=A0A5A7PLK2_STRAF|nr:DNA-binding storekeeper protein-relatedtranscriptional regulator [Striga asiatica]
MGAYDDEEDIENQQENNDIHEDEDLVTTVEPSTQWTSFRRNLAVKTRGRGKNKRKWNNEEDAKLVEALLEMVNLGTYKAENEFKPGYLNYVEDKLRVSLPSSGFKAKPHIESRIKTLKRDFNIVYDMLNGPNTSGFGMDPIRKCIVAEKSVWGPYIESHPTHAIWRNKAFPLYDDLVIIFGEDRATGGNAEGPNDMMEDIQREDVNLNADNDVEATSEIGLDDLDASFSPLQSPRSAAVDKRKKRKRSVDNLTAMTDIKEAASIIGSEIAKASEIFGKAIGVDAEISEKRQRIDSEIRKIPNLAVVDVIKVVCRIAQSPELTDVFLSMTEEGREQLVMAIISGQV